jgi:hypothetical protein
MIENPIIFKMKDEETFQEEFSKMFYKEEHIELEPMQTFFMNTRRKGYKMAKQMGYSKKGGIGLNQKGRLEPVIVTQRKKHMGLGYGPTNAKTKNTQDTSSNKKFPMRM